MSYRLGARAKQDMLATYNQGAHQFGIDQAEHYHRILEATFELLAEHPKMGMLRTDSTPAVRMHPCGSHVIIYTIIKKDVLILRIRHHRENWMIKPV